MGTGGLQEDARQATNYKAAVMAHVSDLTSRSRRLALHRCSFRSANWPFGVGLIYFYLFFKIFVGSASFLSTHNKLKKNEKMLTPNFADRDRFDF